MKKTVTAFALGMALAAGAADTARETFLGSQAYAEMQRVSGEVDVIRQNFSDLEERVRSVGAMRREIDALKDEIAALKGVVAELKREIGAQRGEIVSDLTKKISQIQSASASTAAKPQRVAYKGKTKEYVVESGDNLTVIAKALNTKVDLIKSLNGLKGDNLRVGQKLIVPVEE